jgi:beta-galactosidase GanA
VQKAFVEYCKQKFGTLDKLNKAFGFDYWSNRINTWEDFPSTVGTINASFAAEFAKFQRKLVVDFLKWQADIVREYKRLNNLLHKILTLIGVDIRMVFNLMWIILQQLKPWMLLG